MSALSQIERVRRRAGPSDQAVAGAPCACKLVLLPDNGRDHPTAVDCARCGKPVLRVGHFEASAGREVIRPQPGPQTAFLGRDVDGQPAADIAIFGGSAGSSKTYSLLLECLRHIDNPGYGAVIFRRTFPELTQVGGPWQTSEELYRSVGGVPREGMYDWTFPSGATVTFSHMQHTKDKYRWFGAQVPLVCYDEGQTFEEEQFWFLLSRNRTTCGMRPLMRLSCNPDADSWLAKFLAWWIDERTGYAIPERAGAVRWFVRPNETLVWADDPQELEAEYPNLPPKSVAFFPAKLTDNPILMRADPGYLASLLAMPLVERERLLGGNWKIRPAAGLVFPREALARALVEAVPFDAARVRFWDRAASVSPGACYTAGVLIAKAGGVYYVEDVVRGQWNPGERDARIRATADADRTKYRHRPPEQCAEEEPGSAGKDQALAFYRLLDGHSCRSVRTTGDKLFRANPLASQLIAGNVKILKAGFTDSFVNECASFPEGKYLDQVDAASGSYNELANRSPVWIPPPPLTTQAVPGRPERPAPGAQQTQKWGNILGLG